MQLIGMISAPKKITFRCPCAPSKIVLWSLRRKFVSESCRGTSRNKKKGKM